MQSITSFLKCQKPRRSNRLEYKEKEEIKTKAIKHGPLGYFDILPLELRFHIFGYLTVESLSLMTITSKSMRNLVENYRVSTPYGKLLLPTPLPHCTIPIDQQGEYIAKYKKLGLLLKRSTCLYTTKERLRFVNDFLCKMLCSNSKFCSDASKCIALTCFGKFLHTLIAGWDDTECMRAYESICSFTSMHKTLEVCLHAKPGGHNKMEYDMRMFFRRVFLDQCETIHERAFWMTRILKPLPMVCQARLLYLLYGPAVTDEVLWHEMCENTPANAEQSRQHFGELSNALQILYLHVQEWSEDDVISVLEEITCSPDEWLSENVANLLILCNESLTTKTLISKAINGRVLELSNIMTSLCVVCVKNGFSLNYVMVLTQKLLEVMDTWKEKASFLTCMADTFKEILIDLHEFSSPEDGPDSDLMYMITAFTEYSKKALHLAFSDILNFG